LGIPPLTQREARQFLLLKHGLLGKRRFIGKSGALAYIRQTGGIQYDPLDVCGKTAELVLQSRVSRFTKKTLTDLLYKDRRLFDYPDKCLCILPTEDWPYFARYRKEARANEDKYPEIKKLLRSAREIIRETGPVSADDLKFEGPGDWFSAIHWSAGGNPSRAALEQLYTTGELVIHHKKGARKFYDLSERHIPVSLLAAPEPLPDELAHQKWRVLRRIGAAGMMWNRPGDIWLGIGGLTAETRAKIFNELQTEGKITEISAEGIKFPLYIRTEDMPLLETVTAGDMGSASEKRCELIAPLDCLLWDRKLIKTLFNFHYAWEIYTPAHKRKYGHYTLPLLYGEAFIGRVAATADHKAETLSVQNIWYEDGVKPDKKTHNAIHKCLQRFAQFNDCRTLIAAPQLVNP
jgi:uncharacterized protein YcaQ